VNRPPRDATLDATLPLLFGDGYAYLGRRARELRSDIFEGRAFLQDVTFLYGEDACPHGRGAVSWW
jgi:hypothetical protein